jgi:hypothetical protein
MRKLIMKMSISLDGFVGGPNAGNDWVFKTGDALPEVGRCKGFPERNDGKNVPSGVAK